jgi:hypothetical protein
MALTSAVWLNLTPGFIRHPETNNCGIQQQANPLSSPSPAGFLMDRPATNMPAKNA